MAVTAQETFEYHRRGRPGKIEVVPTKPMVTQRDLSLAYTPGVAEVVLEIERRPEAAYEMTAKANLVAVISNGTAILGLGDRGALASKPVMEGKGVLFKRFADVDVFDIEVDTHDPQEIIRVVKAIAPTFGGINLEDIKSPECFFIEKTLQEQLDIPVFHDDQHGTAIIASAALLNVLEISGKKIDQIKVVFSGAGAAAIATANMFVSAGVPVENIWMVDIAGLVYHGRKREMFPEKARFAQGDQPGTLADVIVDADVFVGLSVADVLTADMVKTMSPSPIIFAMANPNPEIKYEIAKAARPDAIVCTGRSDTQVQAIAQSIEQNLSQAGIRPLFTEGASRGHWTILDYGDVVVHVFYEPVREFYDLDRLWGHAPRLSLPEPYDTQARDLRLVDAAS